MISPRIHTIPRPPSADELFCALAAEPGFFFLDGRSDNPRLSRYSFFGYDPFLVFSSKGREVRLRWAGGADETLTADPFTVLEGLMARFALEPAPDEAPLRSGAVGYLAYDLKEHLEALPRGAQDDLGIPDALLGFYDRVIIYDHRTGVCRIASSGLPEDDPVKAAVRQERRLEECVARIRRRPRTPDPVPEPADETAVSSTFSVDEYMAAVRRAQGYIRKGDIYQVNLSQRYTVDVAIPPAVFYRRLAEVSPAPFSSYLSFDGVAVASSSPERFILKRGDSLETRPIKGTRPRSSDPAIDRSLEEELLASPKDRAEHVMIVDLERNDLGRVCEYGSVRPTEMAILERYPNVFHLVSTVRGKPRPGVTAVACLRATFPGGSITGAPKVRSMEIIDELEPVARSVYTGAIGYLSFDGNIDTAIAIRTVILRGGKAHFSVGGGIVADSDPALEYEETLHKAAGIFKALGIDARRHCEDPHPSLRGPRAERRGRSNLRRSVHA